MSWEPELYYMSQDQNEERKKEGSNEEEK